jgi:hypothetical protein
LIEVQSSKNQDVIMAISTLHTGSGGTNHDTSVNNSTSKLKICGVAIAIISSIGGLAVLGAGLVGFFHIGSWSTLNQVHAIIMMAAGGVVGGAGAICSIVFALRNDCSQKSNHQSFDESDYESDVDTIASTDTTQPSAHNEAILVYGRDAPAWTLWGVDILDKDVPDPPSIQWDANDPFFNKPFRDNYVLVYIPSRIRFEDQEQDLTLNTFREIGGSLIEYFSPSVEEKLGENTAGGWVLLSTTVIPESRDKNYNDQRKMVEAKKNFYMLCMLEATLLNLIVYVSTGKWVYRDQTYTRCIERSKNNGIIVGLGETSLYVGFQDDVAYYYGAACALRQF